MLYHAFLNLSYSTRIFKWKVLDIPQNKGTGFLWNSLHELFPYQALTKILHYITLLFLWQFTMIPIGIAVVFQKHLFLLLDTTKLWFLLALQWFFKSIYFYCWTQRRDLFTGAMQQQVNRISRDSCAVHLADIFQTNSI
jgi:hypothetical protein